MSVAANGYRRSPASSPEDAATINQDRTVVELIYPHAESPVLAARGHLAPGTRAGDYELAEEVGRGAFGTVYRAVHPIIGKEVAVKVLDSLVARDEQLERRFVTEARAVNRIKHPNIVDIFGFGQLENGQTFYVMELLVGETLAKLLKRGGALRPLSALEILEPLADALDAAHRVGVLHRDLKPANVFLHQPPGGAARLKLLDFGVAKILEPSGEPNATAHGTALGTPAYMAPEQWAGESTNASSDIYSLGIIAYELLTGRRPYRGSGTPELVRAHLFDQPDAASGINSALPAAIDRPLAAMLAKRPEERPSSARAAIASLMKAFAETERHSSRLTSASSALSPVNAEKRSDEPALQVGDPAPKRQASFGARRVLLALLVVGTLAAGVPMLWRAARPGQANPAGARSTAARATEPSEPNRGPAAPSPTLDVSTPPGAPELLPSAQAGVASLRGEQVTLLVRGAPARAVVFLNGVQAAEATEPLRVARGSQAISVRLELGGVLLRSYSVVPDRDRVITFAARRRVGPVAPNVNPKSELEF